MSETDFIAALLDPARSPPGGLSDPMGRPVGKRFDVYRNNVAVSLTDALVSGFPTVRKLTGDPFFRAMAGAYLRQHPPKEAVMMRYGAEMPDFLRDFGPAQKRGYLPDIAKLDLAMRRAYHAADADPVAPGTLEQIGPARLMASRLTLAPATQILRSRWPIHGIWAFNTLDDAPKPENRAEAVLIVRPEFDPRPVLLPPGAATFIGALNDRRTFGAALETATDAVPDFDLSATLGLLLTGKAITGISDEEPP